MFMKINNSSFYNPNFKIGIKELTPEQLKEGLPNYEVLLKKIEQIRKESDNVDKTDLEKNTFETLKYDNIFSILGGRGAGKTSVLFTIYKNLKSQDNNIMVPIVMPELLDNDESIISWILSAIEVCLKEIENKIQNESVLLKTNASYKRMCDEYNFFDRCIFTSKNKLRKKFNDLKQNFYNNENKQFGNDYSENTELMAKSTQSGFEIISKFISFWNTLVEVYKKFLEANGSTASTPLIFVFIDDADLKPDIINELLFVIPKFLSHPNVVTVISGSQKTLALAVKYHMYKSITHRSYDLMALMNIEKDYNGDCYKDKNESIVSFSNLRYGGEYYRIKKLSEEILRKLFPVNNRFYIKVYDSYTQKPSFQVFINSDATCIKSTTLATKMSELLKEFYESIINIHKKFSDLTTIKELNKSTLKAKQKAFSFFNSHDTNIHPIYLSFFGRYSRDICAVYFSFYDMLNTLKGILISLYSGEYGFENNNVPEICIERTKDTLISFLRSVITSNKKYSMFESTINDIVKTKFLHWQLYIDYEKVLELYKKPEYYKTNIKNPEPFMEMFCLLNLLEKIIVLVMPQRKKTHGLVEVHEFIKSARIEIIPYDDNIDKIFYQYFVFHTFNLIPDFDIDRLEHQKNFIESVYELNILDEIKKQNNLINEEWLILLSKVFYKRYNLFARINDYSKELILFEDIPYVDNKYIELKEEYYNYIKLKLTNQDYSDEVGSKDEISRDIWEIMKLMEMYVFTLRDCIQHIKIYFNLKNIESEIIKHIESLDIYNNKQLKKVVYSLYQLLKRQYFNRDELMRMMRKIENLIELEYDDYMSLILWLDDLKEIIKKGIDIQNTTNKYYFSTIEEIKNIYKPYVDYYISLMRDRMKKENQSLPSKYNDQKIIALISSNIYQLQVQEWRDLTGME